MSLVAWPAPGDVWHDTHEGGMYAYAVVELDSSSIPEECMLEAYCTMGAADVLTAGEELWPSRDEDPTEGSVPLAACVYLGSTPTSLAGPEHYFQVGREHLTPAGEAVVAALEANVGPVLFVTGLDT